MVAAALENPFLANNARVAGEAELRVLLACAGASASADADADAGAV